MFSHWTHYKKDIFDPDLPNGAYSDIFVGILFGTVLFHICSFSFLWEHVYVYYIYALSSAILYFQFIWHFNTYSMKYYLDIHLKELSYLLYYFPGIIFCLYCILYIGRLLVEILNWRFLYSKFSLKNKNTLPLTFECDWYTEWSTLQHINLFCGYFDDWIHIHICQLI